MVKLLDSDGPVGSVFISKFFSKFRILNNEFVAHRWMDRWMDDLRFYALFNSITVTSGRWADDNERLCTMEPRLRLKRFHIERG